MKSILIRGGSIAAGHGVQRCYADILEDWCRPRGITLISRARHGENSFDGVSTFDEDIAAFRPDVLIIHFGLDDAFGCVYKSEFKENLVCMIRRAREQSSPRILMPTSQPFESPYYMQPAYFYYRIIGDVCHDLHCETVPVHACWNARMMDRGLRYAELVQENVLYPSEQGHTLFAEAIIRRLNSLHRH